MKRSLNQSYGRLRKPAWMKSKKAKASGALRQFVSKAILRSTELKYLDTTVLSEDRNVVTVLNAISQGDDFNQRDGRHVKLRGLQYHITCSSGLHPHRFWIVYDRQCNGTVPAATDILEGAPSVDSFRNVSQWANRFVILKTGVIHYYAGSGAPSSRVPFSVGDGTTSFGRCDGYIALKGRDSEFYSGSTTTLSAGGLYFVTTVVPGSSPSLDTRCYGTFRLSFTD